MNTFKFSLLIVSGLIQSAFSICQDNPKRVNTTSWSDPVNVGTEINTPNAHELCPMVSPDGKYFFFIRKKPGHHFQIYWVKADFIQKLKPEL